VNVRRAVLSAADVDGGGIKVNLLPANVDKLADPQRVPEGHGDEQTVADRVAAIAGGGLQGVDFALRQILALSIISVLGPAATSLANSSSSKSTVDIKTILPIVVNGLRK
jgi:hypothetical protein